MERFDDLWAIFSPLLFAAVLIGISVVFFIHSFKAPEQKFFRLYDGLDIATQRTRARVYVRYHTYDGFLAWFVQTEHRGYLKPEQARQFLGRMVRYNLRWGTLCAGGLLVLLLTVFNYAAQKRAIAGQAATCGEPRRGREEPIDIVDFDEPY